MGNENFERVLEGLKTKACTKQFVYRTTLDVFREFVEIIHPIEERLSKEIVKSDPNVEVKVTEQGDFEFHLKFSGDTLVFIMHTNVFNFPAEHFIHKTNYVKEDVLRGYCGMIQVYNFLSDSLKYGRIADTGILVARIFVNKDRHFFVEGKRQLGVLFNNFGDQRISKEIITELVEICMIQCLDFELLAPPYDMVREITVQQKMIESFSSGTPTGKRMGFKFSAEEKNHKVKNNHEGDNGNS